MRIILGISFLFLTTSSSSIIHACPNSNCGDLFITYPFKLQSSQTAEDGCSYVDLRCNGAPDFATAMNLPNGGGDLYVRNISYEYPYIQLYDPGNCLIGRLIGLNISLSLASSPLEAFAGAKYALYTCPAAAVDVARDGLYRIDCLSNTTNVTVAVDFPPLLGLEGVGCQEIGNYVLPFTSDGFYDDLYLTWDSTSCPACANTGTDVNVACSI
ncbi:uncharacterized protein LOC131023639 [Salvia miltiorrhiza]|uniref:uncharacterized protein LOC131023639 n=1 Tax=Salvia miltiorrhiza TaxID=226208 RepID=UPI0025ABD2DB|nr:uncharacterized protein LOC131023639 [Salvia miltiorrhiza]